MSKRSTRLLPARRLELYSLAERCCIGLIIIGAGILLLAEYIHSLKIPGIALIVMGIAGFAGVRLQRRRLLRRIQQIRAHGDVALRKKVFEDKPHEYRVLARDSLPDADHYFYDNTQRLLETCDFIFLGDVENVSLTKAIGRQRTFNRVLRSGDQCIAAELRHSRSLRQGIPDRYTITFRSEISEGCILTTNNSGGNGATVSHQPEAMAIFLQAKTPAEELLRVHRELLALMKILKPKATLTHIDSIDDYIHLEQRLHSTIARREAQGDFKKVDPKTRAAERMLSHMKMLWASGPHEFRTASLSEFVGLDEAFYDRFRDDGTTNGFVFQRDQEDLTASHVYPHMRTPVRIMLGSDGSITAAAYHLRNPDRAHRIFEFETEFSDATFISTTTAAEQYSHCPGIDTRHFPSTASFNDLLAAHQQRVAAKLQSSPGLDIVKITNLDECLASGRRMHEMKAHHKLARGLINEEDVRKIRGRALTPHEAGIVAEIEKLKNLPAPAESE